MERMSCLWLGVMLFLGTLVLWGCEESVTDTSIVLPYERELVVQGFLTAGDSRDSIWVTQTLPPLERWTIERAAVTDARVVALSKDQELPLKHVANGFYVPDGWTPEAGESYELRVESDGLEVRGVARVPVSLGGERTYGVDTAVAGCYNPALDYWNEYRGDPIDEEQLVLLIDDGADIEYSVGFEIVRTVEGSRGGPQVQRYTDEVWRKRRVDGLFRAILRTECINPSSTDRSTVRDFDSLFVRIVEHEPGYSDYYRSRWADGDDFFGPSGEEPEWNVRGDGFGWFFGRAILRDTITSVP